MLLPFVAWVAEALSVHQLSDHLAAGLHRASEVDLHLLDVHQHLGVHAPQAPHTPLHLGQIAPREAAAQLQAVRQGRGKEVNPGLDRAREVFLLGLIFTFPLAPGPCSAGPCVN